MADDDLKPFDGLYFGMASIRGWDEALREAHHYRGNYNTRVGRVLSSLLFAGGENSEPIAVGGNLNDDGDGHLIVIYPDLAVFRRAQKLSANDGG